MRRLLFSPSWVLRHLLAIFLIGLFCRLGWWQLVKGNSDHGTLQNLFYGFEWPIFAGTVAFFWWKMIREELRPSGGPAPETEPGTIAPTAAVPLGWLASAASSAAGSPGPAAIEAGTAAGTGSDATTGATTTTTGATTTGTRTGTDAATTGTRALVTEGEDDEDLELAAYNRYLASLYESDASGARR